MYIQHDGVLTVNAKRYHERNSLCNTTQSNTSDHLLNSFITARPLTRLYLGGNRIYIITVTTGRGRRRKRRNVFSDAIPLPSRVSPVGATSSHNPRTPPTQASVFFITHLCFPPPFYVHNSPIFENISHLLHA